MDKVVACHQSNFLPWLGFYAKMTRADVFVLLDDVQFTRGQNKHNWTTRVKILGPNGPLWLSLPVRRSSLGTQRILELSTPEGDVRWLNKLIRTLEGLYGKTPHYQEVAPPLLDILSRHNGPICATNIALTQCIAAMLGMKTRVVKSSELKVEGTSNQRLINLTLAENGTTYLAGDGAEDYQVIDLFKEAGLRFSKLGFQHPEYEQYSGRDFVPGLSVFDALCCAGIEDTRKMLL